MRKERSPRTSRTPRALGSSQSSSEELLELLTKEYGKQIQPKANALQRLFAPLRAVTSIPDALHDAIYEQGNIAHLLPEYGKNILGGLGTTFLGREPEEYEKISDIAMKEGYLTSQDPGTKLLRSGVNIVSDIALNPLTYLKFLPTKLVEDLARDATKSAVGSVAGGTPEEIIDLTDKVVSKIANKPISEGLQVVQQELGTKGAEVFYNKLLSSGENLSKAGGLKFMGQTISESPKVAEAVKMIVNPLYGAGKGIGLGAEKLVPEATRNVKAAFYDVFDPMKAAAMTGKGEVAMESLKKMRTDSTLGLETAGITAPLKKLLEKVPEAERDQLAYLIEETTRKGEDILYPLLEGQELSSTSKEFITKYLENLDPITEMLQKKGMLGDIIDTAKQTYLSHKPTAYTKDFVESTLKESMTPERYVDMMKGIGKELEKTGQVGVEKINKYMQGIDTLSGGEGGMNLFKQLASKPRIHPTLKAGEAAGIIYETDVEKLLDYQVQGQLERLSDADFGQVLSNMTDSAGNKFFAEKAGKEFEQSVYLPGVGQRYADRQTARVLENYFGKFESKTGLDKTLEGFDKIMGAWKGLVTGKGPGMVKYHTRNHIDDNLRMILDGADVTKLVGDYGVAQEVLDYQRMVANEGTEYAKEHFKGEKVQKYLKSIGRDGDTTTLWRELLDTGTLSEVGQSAEEVGQMYVPGEMGALDKALTLGGKTMEFEQLRRSAYYLNQLRQTGNSSEAAEAVRRTLFNYNELSKTEKEVFKRIVPFYSFVKNNLKFQLNTMFHQPERYSKFINILDSIQSGFIGPDKDEWRAMPDWLRKESYSIPVSEKDGALNVMSNLGLSFEELEDLGTQGIISNMNPFLKYALEQATGMSTFQERPIAELRGGQRYETHPLRSLLGYAEQERGGRVQKTVDPQLRYMAENLPFISSLNTLLQQSGRIGGPLVRKDIPTSEALEGLVELLSPTKFYEMGVEASKRGKEVEDLDELYELLYRKGISDRFSKYYIPAEIRDRLLKELR